VVLALYGFCELARGLVVGNTADADRHTYRLVTLERPLHLSAEANLQRTVRALPASPAIPTSRRISPSRPRSCSDCTDAFPFVRTKLLLASPLALVGFIVYPTAPPQSWESSLGSSGTTSAIPE
jgi:hypothetical protein